MFLNIYSFEKDTLKKEKQYKNDENVQLKVVDSLGNVCYLTLWGNQIKMIKLLNIQKRI